MSVNSKVPISNEEKIFQYICISISGRASEINWELLNPDDWSQLYETSNKERVAPMFYWSLAVQRYPEQSKIPIDFFDKFKRIYFTTWIYNTGIFQELEKILNILLNAGIEVLILKGAALAAYLYPDIGMRPMGDLDFLIPGSNYPAAVNIVKSLGYKDDIPDAGFGTKDLLAYNKRLTHPDNPRFSIEIHSSIISSLASIYAAPIDWFWDQRDSLHEDLANLINLPPTNDDENVFKFNPTAELVYLSAHALIQHGPLDNSLVWLCDIHRLIIKYGNQIDWNLVIEKSREFNWDYAVLKALLRSNTFFNTPVPKEILDELEDITNPISRYFVAVRANPPKTRLAAEWQKLVLMHWSARIRLILALIFPNPNYMLWRYRINKTWKIPYYYLFRWKEVLIEILKTIFNLNQHKSD